MRGMDFSLNNMTLLALTLAVGIVIDDAIIVLENIFRFMEEKGRDRVQACHRGHARNWAGGDGDHAFADHHLSAHRVHDGICAQVCEFVRLDDGNGDSGFAARGLHADADDEFAPAEAGRKEQASTCYPGCCTWIEDSYLKMLRWSLDHRGVIMLICVVTFLSTFGLYHLVGRDWIPADDQSELQSSFTLPEGTALAKTSAMAADMSAKIVALPEVSFVQAYTHGPTQSCASLYRTGPA